MHLSLRGRRIPLDQRVAVMAIVNRTPDSFFDQGGTHSLEAAVDHALAQAAAGADIVDVGGVKAGPGADVSVDEELERVVPFVEAFRSRSDLPLSVDTYRSRVAEAALDAGADMVNDVGGLFDPQIADVVAARPGSALVLMHAGGPPRTRPWRPVYRPDVVTAVAAALRQLVEQARARGVAEAQIVIDPGHDFAKNSFHSMELTRRMPELCAVGYPVLVALSNKDFLGEAAGLPLHERAEASLAAAVVAVVGGARIVRVHDTAGTVRALRAVEAIMGWRPPAAALRGLA